MAEKKVYPAKKNLDFSFLGLQPGKSVSQPKPTYQECPNCQELVRLVKGECPVCGFAPVRRAGE